jgi:uncharacterized protein YkwD
MPVAVPPVTATAAQSQAVAAQSQAEKAIVREINRRRRAKGLRGVRVSAGLTRIARSHSRSMLKYDVLTHSSFDGTSFGTRLQRAGHHRRYGETLAWAPSGSGTTARVLVRMWMRSAHHRAVLLDGSLRRIGVGRVHGAMGAQRGSAITADWSS